MFRETGDLYFKDYAFTNNSTTIFSSFGKINTAWNVIRRISINEQKNP